jgi:uncharacterized Tic20 family protein
MPSHRHQPPAPIEPDPPSVLSAQVQASPSCREMHSAGRAYLGVPIAGCIPPLWVYLVSGRRSPLARRHAAQALGVSCAAILYGICLLIVAGMLALDSVEVAVIVVAPLALALWLILVVFLVRAARAARRDQPYDIPGWLRVSPRR